MKRLLAAILVLASLAAAPAAEAPSELKPFVRGSWQEMLRSHKPGVRRWCISGVSPAAPARSNCRCSDNS